MRKVKQQRMKKNWYEKITPLTDYRLDDTQKHTVKHALYQ